MKFSKNDVRSSVRSIPNLRFEEQQLTSFAGSVIYQAAFQRLGLGPLLRKCTRGTATAGAYGLHSILRVLIVHLMLGWRRLRDVDYYRDDPMLPALVGLKRLPSASTLSRGLRQMTPGVVDRMRGMVRSLVMDRVVESGLSRLTIDFDGSVLSTKSRGTEGTAAGFNKKAKGERSYYPLFATIAQTGQVFDVLHRPGNVHDSREALEFIDASVGAIRDAGFRGQLESRLDSAHFSDNTCLWLDELGVEFSVTAPFERFPELKAIIESRKRWRRIDDQSSFFEPAWAPKKWRHEFRVIVYRTKLKKPRKGEIQLHLFEPLDWDFEYKVVVTNKDQSAKAVLSFHDGRGSQEGCLGELKSHANLDYIPTRRLIGNQVFLLSSVMAYNLNREIQMTANDPERATTPKRAALWVFEKIGTFRQRLVLRAGRLTRPKGRPTLSMAANRFAATDIRRYVDNLQAAG